MKKSNTKKAILRTLVGIAFINSTLLASPLSIKHYKESKDNYLLCRVGNYSYQMISQKNSSLHKINGDEFFKIKSKNLYISNAGCQIVEKRD